MHGLIFGKSIHYWQDQPGIRLFKGRLYRYQKFFFDRGVWTFIAYLDLSVRTFRRGSGFPDPQILGPVLSIWMCTYVLPKDHALSRF